MGRTPARAAVYAVCLFQLLISFSVAQGVWHPGVNMGPVINTSQPEQTSDIPAARNAATQVCLGTNSVPALVTVQTSGPEQFVVRITDQALLDQMVNICLGLSPQLIVLGDLSTGNRGYNRDTVNAVVWSWHLAEGSITLAENTIELCDGIPSFMEADLQLWIETVGSFCPWSSMIVAIAADTSINGDFDIDGDVDSMDFARLENCFTGSANPCYSMATGCCATDMDRDTDIDCDDGSLFVAAWTDVGNPPGLAQCAMNVPTVSEWGLLVMALLLLTVGAVLSSRRGGDIHHLD